MCIEQSLSVWKAASVKRISFFLFVFIAASVPVYGYGTSTVSSVVVSTHAVGNSSQYATATVTIARDPEDGLLTLVFAGSDPQTGESYLCVSETPNGRCYGNVGLLGTGNAFTIYIGASNEVGTSTNHTFLVYLEHQPGSNFQDPGQYMSVTVDPVQYSVQINPSTVNGSYSNSGSATLTITRAQPVWFTTAQSYSLAAASCGANNQLINYQGTTAQFTIPFSEVAVTSVFTVSPALCGQIENGGQPFAVGQATLTVIGDGQVDDHGPCKECEGAAGAPINLGTGDVWVTKTDYSVSGLGGGLHITRTWNSLWQHSTPVFQTGMFGTGWISNLEERLQQQDSTHIKYWRGDGNGWIFVQNSPGSSSGFAYSIQVPGDEHATLLFDTTAMLYTLTLADGSQKIFDNAGYLRSWSDRNGNATTIAYDSAKRVTQVAGAGGQAVTFTYANSQLPNLVAGAQDSVGSIATYVYSGEQLSRVTYADASALQYSYDTGHNIMSVVDAQGKVLETHTYDSQGRGLTSANANGVGSISLQYSSDMSNITLTDSKGNATSNYFQPAGGRSRITSAYGPSCESCGAFPFGSYNYDQSGNRIYSADGNGTERVFYAIDGQGNVTSRYEYAILNGRKAYLNYSYTYNNFNEVLTASDPLGNVTTNAYDANGNLLTTTTPSPDGSAPGSTTTFTYDSKGQLLTVTDPRNHTTTMIYSPAGLIASVADANGQVSTFGYDARGNRIRSTDAAGQTTNFTFDSMNRVTNITYPDSSTTQFAYDARSRRTSVTDANGKVTSYAYDDVDRLISVTDGAGHATAYAYDTENNLVSVTDAAAHTTSFAYDASRRVVQTTFPSSLTETYAYDNDGNLLSKTDRKGNSIAYTYDQLSRLTQKAYPDSTSVSYIYDLNNHLTQVSDPTGTYNFTYDNLGRLTQTSTQYAFLSGQTLVNNYTYDADSNRMSFANPQGGVTSYAYDALNRLSSVTDFAGRLFTFSYDALSRRTGLTRPNGVNTSYSYDSLSRLLSVLHQAGSTALDGATYTYDAAGNRTSRAAQPANVATNYAYDAIYQLLTAKQGATTKESFTYDAVGNRTYQPGAPYTYNASNEMLTREGVPYTYDADGNTLSKTNGSGATSYAWDFENRLSSVSKPDGSVIGFRYDPFGRRISKTPPSGTMVTYVYDGDNIIEELNGATGTLGERYTYGPEIGEPLVGEPPA